MLKNPEALVRSVHWKHIISATRQAIYGTHQGQSIADFDIE